MSQKITVPVHAVEIERGKDVIAVEVPAHEVEVLRVVHGPANVRIATENVDEIELDGGADAELMRLSGRYKRLNAPDPVRLAFPSGPRDIESLGFRRGEGVREAPQSVEKNHRKTAAKPAKAAK